MVIYNSNASQIVLLFTFINLLEAYEHLKHSDQPASAPQVGVLATGSNDMMVRLWNPVVTTRPTSVLGGHKVKHTRPSHCFSTPVDIPL